MSAPSDTLATRFARLLKAEATAVQRELDGVVATGEHRNRAVHQARKALQRLRALLRLLHDVDAMLAAHRQRRLRSCRRRLGSLRDAQVRIELVEDLIAQQTDPALVAHLRDALARLRQRRDAAWAAISPTSLQRLQLAWQRERQRLQKLPLELLQAVHVRQALERERRRVRRRLREALGVQARETRHDLRRQLRRYALMRTAAAKLLGRRDPWAKRLADAARNLGSEGDLWLTRNAFRSRDRHADVHELGRALERRRRTLCKRHDGELVALRRGALGRPRQGPVPDGPRAAARKGDPRSLVRGAELGRSRKPAAPRAAQKAAPAKPAS